MYEIFLSTVIPGNDHAAACALLSGLCEMPAPWRSVHRVLYFQGPPRAAGGLANWTRIDKTGFKRDAAVPSQWKEMQVALARQSYIVQTRFEVSPERDFGPAAAHQDLNAVPGVIRWTDYPDPPAQARPMVTQRKVIEIWDQKNLPAIMQDNRYVFKNELIEETCQFFRDDLEFVLYRQLLPKPLAGYLPLDQLLRNGSSPVPLATLPPRDSLEPFDAAGRWMMMAKIYVQNDNAPDELRKAGDALMAVRRQLEGAIEFRALDRKIHDTRVALTPQ